MMSSKRSHQLSVGGRPKPLSRPGTEMGPEPDDLHAALMLRFRDVQHLPLPIPPVRAKRSETNIEAKCACCLKLNREVSNEPNKV